MASLMGGEADGRFVQAHKTHLKILLAQLNPLDWLEPVDLSPPYYDDEQADRRSFTNFVLPLLMHYGDGRALSDLLRDHPWLSSCTASAKRHEDAWLFHQSPTQNIEVLEEFLKLQFCEIFGSSLLRRSTVCGVVHQYYLNALERIVRVRSSVRIPGNSSKNISPQSRRKIVDISETDDIEMQSLYGDLWRRYVSRLGTEDMPSARSLDSSIEGGLHKWQWICGRNRSGRKDLIHTQVLMRQAVYDYLNTPRKQIETHKLDIKRSPTTKKFQLADFCKKLEKNQMIPTDEVWTAWTNCRTNPEGLSQWAQVVDNTGQFCLAAGSPEASKEDPFESLRHLRKTLSRHFLYTADLHKWIFNLQAQINQQQRTITALVYRGVLENIVAEENGRGPVEKWKNFLKDRVFFDDHQGREKMREDLKKRNQGLDEFLNTYRKGQHGQQHIREMADHLYSTLSRAIHNFRLAGAGEDDQYDVSSSQFDPMERDFLLALKPLSANVAVDGTVDWEKEQERYPVPSPLTSVQSAKSVLPPDLRAPEPDIDNGNIIFGSVSSEEGSGKKRSNNESIDEEDDDDSDSEVE
ncbi:hypothetical protein Hte_010371 [Hypoxylon texense]